MDSITLLTNQSISTELLLEEKSCFHFSIRSATKCVHAINSLKAQIVCQLPRNNVRGCGRINSAESALGRKMDLLDSILGSMDKPPSLSKKEKERAMGECAD